jgi:iron complex outermembrane receptor protein
MGYTIRGLTANYDFDSVSLFYGFSSTDLQYPSTGFVFGGALTTGIDLAVRTHELRLGTTGKGPLKWTLGYYRRDAERHDFLDFALLGINTNNNTDIAGSSLFGEVSYTLPQVPVELTAGVRRFRDTVHQQDYNVGAPAPANGGKFSATNPRFSVSWHVDPLWQIYSSAAKGFRSGQSQTSAALLYANAVGIEVPTSIPPDSIWTYELGTKASVLDRRLMIEAAIYHSNWKHFAVNQPLGATGLYAIQPSPGTTTNGIEGSVRFEFTRSLGAALNAGYAQARYEAAIPGTGVVKGSPVDYVSPLVWGASADYAFGIIEGWNSRLHLGFQHSGKRVAPVVVGSTPGDAINNLNARIGFEQGPWTLSLFGENLTNDNGASSARVTQAVSATESVTYSNRIRPRTLGLELRYWMGR